MKTSEAVKLFFIDLDKKFRELTELTEEIKDMEKYCRHIHKNNGINDGCACCKLDLRHPIHLRKGER